MATTNTGPAADDEPDDVGPQYGSDVPHRRGCTLAPRHSGECRPVRAGGELATTTREPTAWEQADARLRAAQRAVNGHPLDSGPSSLVLGPLATIANSRRRLVEGRASLARRLVRDGHTAEEAEQLVGELELAYVAWSDTPEDDQ